MCLDETVFASFKGRGENNTLFRMLLFSDKGLYTGQFYFSLSTTYQYFQNIRILTCVQCTCKILQDIDNAMLCD